MPYRSRIALAASVALVLCLTACAPEPQPPASNPSASTPVSPAPLSPSPSETGAQPTPSRSSNGLPDCWTVAVPGVQVVRSQTPEEFAAENPPLIAAGAPATCSLFAEGSQRTQGDAWIEGFVAQGWVDGGAVQDDVYVSRSAVGPRGETVSYLISVDGSSPSAVSQFQLYGN